MSKPLNPDETQQKLGTALSEGHRAMVQIEQLIERIKHLEAFVRSVADMDTGTRTHHGPPLSTSYIEAARRLLGYL